MDGDLYEIDSAFHRLKLRTVQPKIVFKIYRAVIDMYDGKRDDLCRTATGLKLSYGGDPKEIGKAEREYSEFCQIHRDFLGKLYERYISFATILAPFVVANCESASEERQLEIKEINEYFHLFSGPGFGTKNHPETKEWKKAMVAVEIWDQNQNITKSNEKLRELQLKMDQLEKE